MEGILKLGKTEVEYNNKTFVVFDKVRYHYDDYYILVDPKSGRTSKCLCGDLTNVNLNQDG